MNPLLGSSLGSLGKSVLNALPVNDLPDILKEICLSVLVINVEGVFPDIDVKEWY